MPALGSPPRSLSELRGDGETHLAEFFDVWSADLPPGLAAINCKVRDSFIGVHGRTRFASVFKLNRALAEGVMAECGAGEGWIDTMEDLSGFTFAAPTVPSTASLSGGDPAHKPSKKKRTLSDDVRESAAGYDGEVIPDAVFDAVKCKYPGADTLEPKDVSAFTDALLLWAGARHNAWNFGLPLARHYAEQAARRLPKLPAGKTKGAQQGWTDIIMNKTKNRTFVRPYP